MQLKKAFKIKFWVQYFLNKGIDKHLQKLDLIKLEGKIKTTFQQESEMKFWQRFRLKLHYNGKQRHNRSN